MDICYASSDVYNLVAEKEVSEALSSLNKGKVADIYSMTTERLLVLRARFCLCLLS